MELQLFFSEFFNANFYLSTCCALLNIFNFVEFQLSLSVDVSSLRALNITDNYNIINHDGVYRHIFKI